MTDNELIAYFDTAILPDKLRIDRATTQFDVKDAVERNIEAIKIIPNDGRARYRLTSIMKALENPYDGPEIPRF